MIEITFNSFDGRINWCYFIRQLNNKRTNLCSNGFQIRLKYIPTKDFNKKNHSKQLAVNFIIFQRNSQEPQMKENISKLYNN